MNTKIFGNPSENYIEVKTNISYAQKTSYINRKSARDIALMRGDYEALGEIALDPNINLLKESIITLKEGDKTYFKDGENKITWDIILNSSANNLAMQEAVDYLLKENWLGNYSEIKNAATENLKSIRKSTFDFLNEIDKELELRGNLEKKSPISSESITK
ncbi:MAG: hypothetical protein MJH09_00965 [Cetobacterium sp.]|nr:hypothetical protein [Cetobacterium sp.]